MEVKFISLKAIIDRIMLNPLFLELKYDSAIIWATDVMNLIEVPEYFIQKVSKIFVENYRGYLPYDYIAITKIDVIENNGRHSTKVSTDPFLKGYKNRVNFDGQDVEIDYRIEGDYIYTGLESGTLEIAYKALPLDSDNYIMIPDNTFIIKAVESYIKVKYLEILYDLDEISRDKLEKAEQEYCWSVGQAQSQRQFDNLDKLESVRNALSRIVLLKDYHETDYRYASTKEHRRI